MMVETQQLRENIVKIEPDFTERNVYVHKPDKLQLFDAPMFIHNYTQIPTLLGIEFTIPGKKYSTFRAGRRTRNTAGDKQYNQALAEYLGMPPTLWARVFNLTMGRVWIDPVQPFVSRFAYNCIGKARPESVCRIWQVKELLEQLQTDGLDNLTPFAFYLKATPKQMKELVGKNTWKKICKNSFTRNKLLAQAGPNLMTSGYLKKLNELPSTVLQHRLRARPIASLSWAVERRDCYLKDRRRIRELSILYDDTERLCGLLGREFNSKWSLRRMQEEHDHLSHRQREMQELRRQKEKELWRVPFEYPVERVHVEDGDYSADLLMTPEELLEEGQEMRHCVASYAEMCRKGSCFIASVRYKEKKSSTLEVRRVSREVVPSFRSDKELGVSFEEYQRETITFRKGQHLGKCNMRVEDSLEIQVAEKFIEELSKQYHEADQLETKKER